MSDSESSDTPAAQNRPSASAVIEAFGGIRPMASRLGIAVSTVQGWKMRDAIPPNRWDDVEAAARVAGIDLSTLPRTGTSARTEDMGPEGAAQGEEAAESPEQPASGDDTAETPETPETPETDASGAAEQSSTKDLAQPDTHAGMELPPLEGRRRGGTVVAWSALLIGVIALVAIVARPIWAPFVQPFVEPIVEAYLPKIEQTEPPQPTTADTAGAEQLGELAARIAGLETKVDNLVRLQEDITRLDTRVKGLADRPVATDGASPEQLASVEENVAAIDTRLGDLASRFSEAESRIGSSVSATDFTQRMAALDQSLQTLSDNAEAVRALASRTGTALTTIERDVSTLNARLTDIANRPVQTGARAAAVVLAVGQLETAMAAGEPFSGQLDQLARLVGDDGGFAEPMAALRAHAASGLPTRTELTRQFVRLAPAATRKAKLDAAESWVDKTLARVSGLVTVRRIDGEPTGPDAPVTAAERALSRDDLAAAVDALKGMDGPVADWVADADARLGAETALASLRAMAIDRLGAAEAELTAETAQ